jgi:hypothetical protein
MSNRDQQSRWAAFPGRRVGAVQLCQADRLCRSRSAAEQRRSDTAPELKARDSRSRSDG